MTLEPLCSLTLPRQAIMSTSCWILQKGEENPETVLAGALLRLRPKTDTKFSTFCSHLQTLGWQPQNKDSTGILPLATLKDDGPTLDLGRSLVATTELQMCFSFDIMQGITNNVKHTLKWTNLTEINEFALSTFIPYSQSKMPLV